MPKTQYTEKPHKVLAEQYDGTTLIEGACDCTANAAWTAGRHVHAPGGMVALVAGLWIVQDPWTPTDYDVLSAEEFDARFGKGATVEEG